MIQELKRKEKKYVCLSFFLDKNSPRIGVFNTSDNSLEKLKTCFGVDNIHKYDINGYFYMGSIFNLVNDIVNIEGVNLISVSEDDESMRYHFIIES